MPKGSKVLMADDDKMLIDMYKERLELAGYMVTLCRNGEEALAKIREAKPDIILLDIMMPKINGYEALASIKSDPSTKDIPVIMLSALMRDFNREKAVEAGADDYLIKSEAMPADVITKVEQVLAKYGKGGPPAGQSPLGGAVAPNIPAPSATPPPMPVTPDLTNFNPLPNLPPSPVEKPAPPEPKPEPEPEPPAPFVSPQTISDLSNSSSAAPTPEPSVMQPDAPKTDNKVVFTPEPKKPEKPEKPVEEVPVIKISSAVVPETQPVVATPPPVAAMPWEREQEKPEKKERSLASVALVVAIAMLLTTLINDLAIYFFFFAKK